MLSPVSTPLNERPFTALVNRCRRDGLRYEDLDRNSHRARSSAWFNNLVNSYRGPWKVAPPSPEAWPGLATLLGISEQHVREAIAREWFGVGPDVSTTADVRQIIDIARDLDPSDLALLRLVAQRLSTPRVSDTQAIPGLDLSMPRDLEF